jgi:hypothetical protein
MERAARCREAKESWRPRIAGRSAWSAIEALPDPEPQPDPKRSSKQDVVIAMLRQPEGATVDEVASVTGWQRHIVRGVAEVDREIARLVDRSTQDLRRAWQTLHHTGPPLGLSRDLIIRGLADQLQDRTQGGPSRALQRRFRILAREFERGARSFDPARVLKTGAILVRQWRRHAHTVLVREDGFEYDVQHYRSLTVIAERITGAHWSGPRFFGLSKRARAF